KKTNRFSSHPISNLLVYRLPLFSLSSTPVHNRQPYITSQQHPIQTTIITNPIIIIISFMSIRFKFRSSVNFDSIEIDGGESSISVAQLRSKILNKINGHKDFYLVFFDHLTGQEYNDDEFNIPSGSSVIVKRVPAQPVLRRHKVDASELSEDVPKGMDHNKPEEIVLENNLAPEDREHIKLEKVANAKGIDLQKVDLPSELRCPICITYFKEAAFVKYYHGRQGALNSGRTCYKCGSPGHFIRDCPMASTEHPMLHTGDHMFQGGMSGYAMPYWNPAAFSYVNPYMNMYGNYPGMVPFNSAMVPVTPYGVPPYVPSTYGSLPVPSGVTRMGGMAPVGSRAEPFRYSENYGHENSDSRVKCSHEKRQRSSDYEDNDIQKRHDYHETERSSEYKSNRGRGMSMSNSDGSHGQKLLKDHQKMKSGHTRCEKRSHGSNHTDRSVSGLEDVHSGNNRSDEARHKKYNHESSRRHRSSKEQSDSDCSYNRHQVKKEKYVKTRQMGDRKKPIDDEFYGDRRKMMNDSDDDYHHNKRKRMH
ncbi:hypothetical protein M8C21_008313, partial [Ambrosia artemisiifolia]